jgi:hypothetical protein
MRGSVFNGLGFSLGLFYLGLGPQHKLSGHVFSLWVGAKRLLDRVVKFFSRACSRRRGASRMTRSNTKTALSLWYGTASFGEKALEGASSMAYETVFVYAEWCRLGISKTG